MDIQKSRRITKLLCILWLVTFVTAGTISNAYIFYAIARTGTSPVTMLSPYQLLVLAVSLLYFYPLLFLIHHYAKIAAMKAIVICARIGIAFFSIWNVMAIIATVYTYLSTTAF